MRSGSLTALASRTLGVATLLRPATPSRFEPDGPQSALREIVDLGATDAEVPTPERRTAPVDPTLLAPPPSPAPIATSSPPVLPLVATTAEPPLLGSWEPDPVDRRRTASPPLGVAAGADAGADVASLATPKAGPRVPPAVEELVIRPSTAAELAVDEDRTSRRSDEPIGVEALARAASRQVDPPAPTNRASVPRDARSQGAGHAIVSDRPDEDPVSEAPPSIVVHIGRVDIRAVAPTPPPPPSARPRPSTGPSLAEHLLARDRGQR